MSGAYVKPPESGKKRWSIGRLFRRKSRKSESESSSSEEEREEGKKRGFLGRRKRSQQGSKDVTGSFVIQPAPKGTPESRRKGETGSSSEEGGSLRSRRSRAARTERYMRRLSREVEAPVRPLSYAFEAEARERGVSRRASSEQQIPHCTPPGDRRRPRPLPRPPLLRPLAPRHDQYLSDSQLGYRNQPARLKPVRDATYFWRQKDLEVARSLNVLPSPRVERAGSASPRLNGFVRHHYRVDSASSLSGSEVPRPKPPEESPRGSFEKVSSLPRKKEEEFRPLSIVVEKSEQSDLENSNKLKPPTPPERKSSRQNSVSSADTETVRERPSSNLEDALNELEEIYRSLKIGEEELWEGRIRRGADSDSGYSCDTLRSRATDDMAYRRMNKRESRFCPDAREIISRAGSYLLVSPTLSPPPLIRLAPPINSEPDITLDDVVYRSVNHTNNTLRILDPQPPFGIPLGPVSPAPDSDYLHVTPICVPKPSPTPDLVMDDLAFRNLRKDSETGVSLKKKKAVRSLSANLSGYILRDFPSRKEVNNNVEAFRPKSVRAEKQKTQLNATEGLRLAHRMLDNRRKALYKREDSPVQGEADPKNGPSKEELRRRFFSEAYRTLEESKESQLLQQLEDEARATSHQIGKELEQLKEKEEDTRSVAELLKELTKSLDWDYGRDEERWGDAGELSHDPLDEDLASYQKRNTIKLDHPTDPYQQGELSNEQLDEELASYRKKYRTQVENPTVLYQQEDCVERCDRSTMVAPTHNMNDGREERVARYKEERRRQLAAQFGSREPTSAVRSTRASRLRSLANTESVRTNKTQPSAETNKSEEEHCNGDLQKKEKDKSHKRKSYLNRSITAEVVPQPTTPLQQGDRRKENGSRAGRISSPREASGSPSPIPRSSQLVKRQVNSTKRNERGSTPESDGSSGSSRIPRKVPLVQTPSPLSTPSHKPQLQRVRQSLDGQQQSQQPAALASSLPTSPARQPHSILKKSSLDETSAHHPVSILKRKTSQEDGGGRSGSPVRFSPNTVEKKGSRGILKKHRSLDDSRHSPESHANQNGVEECRPILKTQQRRCSLEEVVGAGNGHQQSQQSCGQQEPQGILKRKTSRDEGGHQESMEPQGILKRKSSSPSRIAAAESVIRSAAESLADLDLSSTSSTLVKPILVKKKEDDDHTPRPILKKKSSSEEEEHPVKPILKAPKKEDDLSGVESPVRRVEVKPILKHSDESFGGVVRRVGVVRGERQSVDAGIFLRRPKSPLALDMARPRPLSVAERVYNLESFLALEGELVASPRRIEKMEGEEFVGLQRSGSVSERASMWAKLEKERQAEAATPVRKSPKGTARTRSKVDLGRFNTQPVTQVEVEQAKRNNTNNTLDCVDEEDPSRLSVTERVKLFSPGKTRGGQPTGLPPRPLAITKASSPNIVAGLMKNVELKNSPPVPRPRMKLEAERREAEEAAEQALLAEKRKAEERKVEEVKEEVASVVPTRRGSTSSSASLSSSGEESSEEGEEVRNITRVVRKQEVTVTRKQEILRKEEDEETSSSGGREVITIMNNKRREARTMERYGEVTAIRRCATQPIPSHHRDETDDSPLTIAQRLAALQKSGHSEWKKRIARPKPEEELPPPSANKGRVLADRVGKLETAAQGWKARIPLADSSKFTVAGRMTPSPTPPPALGGASRTPAPFVFQAPSPPLGLLRSASLSSKDTKLSMNDHEEIPGPIVTVPEICDEEFSSFFSTPLISIQSADLSAEEVDFEHITSHHSHLLVHKKKVRVRRKHLSTNPVKALAQRSDLKTEYVEVRSANIERERKTANMEKMSRMFGLAAEVLAGLASVEDVKSVSLRKAGESPRPWAVTQWPHPLLLRVKGRRHPVTSVVSPRFSSVNQGDSFVLVTQSQVFHWIGEFSNVIEKSRGKEIAQEVQLRRDLGCLGAPCVITLQGQAQSENHNQFWQLLSLPENMVGKYTGEAASQHPDEEDMVFEVAIGETYMVYSLFDEQLVPVQSSWGKLPRVELLESSKVLVFDFGSEVYVWSGKNVEPSERKLGSHLAKELHKQRHTNWHPTGIEWLDAEMEGKERPEWSVVCKVTQHMEPVLFREKFVDWPSADISSTAYHDKQVDGSVEVSPCNVEDMLHWSPPPPDFVLEATHLGRGKSYFDEDTLRHLEVLTLCLRTWRVERENSSKDYRLTDVGERSAGQMHQGESYVLRWEYRVTVSGRELSGEISKHGRRVGRDRLACLVWQGSKAPTLEQGAAALLAIEEEAGGKIVMEEGSEPPAFRAALRGPLVVHCGRHNQSVERIRLFACSGEIDSEAMLQEVSPSTSSLRSRASFWMLDTRTGKSYLWHGSHTLLYHKQVSLNAVSFLIDTRPPELGLGVGVSIAVEEIDEGDEPHNFLSGVDDREEYDSYLEKEMDSEWVPRLFHLNPVQVELKAVPIVSTCFHPDFVTPYPYQQQDLYSIIQPGLAVLDSGKDIWVWEGWWEGNGGVSVRREARRRAAMTSALQYSARRRIPPSRVHLVWAGLEPVQFTNLFLTWTPHEEAANANSKDGYVNGEKRSVQEELALLTKCTYPPSALLRHPLPAGVDPTRLELYLEPQHFKELLGVCQEEFSELPLWQQTKLKKSAGLF